METMEMRLAVFADRMREFGALDVVYWCDILKCFIWERAWFDESLLTMPLPYGVDERPVIYWGC